MNDELVGQILGALVNKNDNDGFGGNNGALWLIIILVLFGGWGGRGNWGGNQGGAGSVGGDALYPWLNQSEQISGGFRDQMINGGITGIQQSVTGGFADVLQALCAGFGGVNMNIANGFSQAEISANNRQMANMQQQFGIQTAMMQGFNGVQAQQADCCCENRLAMANQTATLLAEHCSDRQALNDGIQRVIDKLCDQELQAERRENDNLRQQINMMNLAASQNAQTQQLLADNFAQTNALEQYLAPVPRPAYIVQNPSCCQQGFGCGCAA